MTTQVEPLEDWMRQAEVKNPTLALIKSKGEAADQGITAAKSEYLPQVFAFGQYNFITNYLTPIEPNWDRRHRRSTSSSSAARIRASKVGAAQAQKTQVNALEAEAVNTIHSAVETAWLRLGRSARTVFSCSIRRWRWRAKTCACVSAPSKKGSRCRST